MARTGLNSTRTGWIILVTGSAAAAILGIAAAQASVSPSIYRYIVAAIALATVLLVSVGRPELSVILTLSFLPFLGLVRRLLIPLGGWTPYDPLLIAAPLVALIFVVRVTASRPRLGTASPITKAVAVLFGVQLLAALNPLSGSLVAGVTGLLFVAVPLLWYFVGLAMADDAALPRVLTIFTVAGITITIYGLYQSVAGFPAWDRSWISFAGYNALSVGGVIRAFGTLASSAEYAAILSLVLLSLGIQMFTRRAPLAFAISPLFLLTATALILESQRSAVVLVVAAFMVIIWAGLRGGHSRIVVIVVMLAGLSAADAVFGGWLGSSTVGILGSPLVSHQVSGLLDPFNPQRSTLTAHFAIMISGFTGALTHPMGIGAGVTTIAAGRLGGVGASTEFDISDEFVIAGLAGGLLYLGIVCAVFWRTYRLYRLTRSWEVLLAVGLLVATAGQWLNGGLYALSPLIWFVIGACEARLGRTVFRGEDEGTSGSRRAPEVLLREGHLNT